MIDLLVWWSEYLAECSEWEAIYRYMSFDGDRDAALQRRLEKWEAVNPRPPWWRVSRRYVLPTALGITVALVIIGWMFMFGWFLAGHPGCWLGTGAHCNPPRFFWTETRIR